VLTAAQRSGAKSSLDIVEVRDVLRALLSKNQGEAMVDVACSTLTKAEQIIQDQAGEIQLLRRALFGRRTERVAPEQEDLFSKMVAVMGSKASESASEAEGDSAPKPAGGGESGDDGEGPPKDPSKRRNPGRRPLTPTRTEKILVPDGERACPVCGAERCVVGHVNCVVIEYIPAKIEVVNHRREKLACKPCEGEFIVAPLPEQRVIDRALPGPDLLATLATNKMVDGLPKPNSKDIYSNWPRHPNSDPQSVGGLCARPA
jgi:transposase